MLSLRKRITFAYVCIMPIVGIPSSLSIYEPLLHRSFIRNNKKFSNNPIFKYSLNSLCILAMYLSMGYYYQLQDLNLINNNS